MNIHEIVPTSYQSWRHCITQKCKIALTPDYIAQRLNTLRDRPDDTTSEFRRLFGEAHLHTVIGWFEQAQRDVNSLH